MVDKLAKLQEAFRTETEERKRKEEIRQNREKELKKAKEAEQKKLQSAERVEIEQLRSESNRANKTVQELENGLKGWIRAYDHLQLEKSIALKEWEILFLDYERQIDELEQARSEKIALRADYNELKAINKNLERDKKALKNKITGLESDKATLEANIIDLEIGSRFQELQAAKEKYQVLFIISFLLLVVISLISLVRWWMGRRRRNKATSQPKN